MKGSDAKGQYLHRTVKDVSKRRTREDLSFLDQATFDPNIQFCAAFLLHMKGLDQRRNMFLDKFWAVFSDCTQYSTRFKYRAANAYLTVFDQLDRVGHELYDSKIPDDLDGRTWLNTIVAYGRSTKTSVLVSMPTLENVDAAFVNLFVSLGLRVVREAEVLEDTTFDRQDETRVLPLSQILVPLFESEMNGEDRQTSEICS